uniref:Uncharacterized protein n=1 Tax=Oryza sativa subsp. japonica TaxID=39947 RepID=Q2R8K8_ORYSJ|nr:hypothetical protein LOC_Os11g11840 [Oryza sativa Japonica Group]
MHTIKETELLATKLDLLMKCLDDHKKRPQGTAKALDSHVMYEVCGGMGHSGNDCPETCEEAMHMGNNSNGYRLQGGQGWNQTRPYYQGGNNNGNFCNQPSLKDLVFAQAKTTDALAQLASLVPANETRRIPGQPDSSIENVKAITTRGGKSTRDPPYPNPTGTNGMSKETPCNDSADKEIQPENTVPQEYCDTLLLPFPQRSRKPSVDKQFACFVEVIQKIHINVPSLDAMQVPTYARYLKDILKNKRPLPTTEVVKLTEHYSNIILHKLPEKKKDPGCPTITCSIEAQQFDQALCDLGASVSVMPKDVFDKLNFTVLTPTPMRLQLANSSVRYPAGIAEDVPVKIRDFFIPVDFVVLDMDTGKEKPLILGRPFLSTVGANIDVGTGSIRLHINGKEEKFEFQPRTEQCSMVRIKYGPNPQNIQEVKVEPPKTDSLESLLEDAGKITYTAKKLEQSAQKKPSSTPKSKKVWKEKPKTPAPLPPETGGKSMN